MRDHLNPRRWWILAVVLMAECMDLLDGTVVNIAAPAIHRDLHASATQLQWIVGGYALAIALALITGGRFGDLFGRRRMFLIGVSAFTIASLLCGFAPTSATLIIARLAQGAGGALMLPQGMGLLRESFPSEEMPKVFAMFGPVMGLAALLGPIIGGGLVGLDLFGTGWRLVFLVNLPVGLLAIGCGLRLLPAGSPNRGLGLDWLGSLMTAVAGAALVYPLMEGRSLGWPAWTFVAMALGVAGLVGFAYEQRRRDRAGHPTLVTPSVFAHRGYTVGLATALLFFAAMIGAMLTLTLYLQLGEGFSALHAGLTLIPWSFGAGVGAGCSGAVLGPKLGRIVVTAGGLVMLAGFALVIAASGGTVSSLDLAPALLVSGIGMGLVVAPLFDIILAAVTDEELGSGSGVLNAIQQLAAAIGVAALGTVFFGQIAHGGFAHALHSAMWVALAFLVAVTVLSLGLPRWARENELVQADAPSSPEPIAAEVLGAGR
jgi:EmrB/QacA subfamily drug resistance transporter